MRPKHEAAIEEYLRDDWAPLEPTLKSEDSAAFFAGLRQGHRLRERVAREEGEALHPLEGSGLPSAGSRHDAAQEVTSRIEAPVRGASLVTGALSLLAYLTMTPAASGDKDGSEFTLVLATLGAAHPTGYPLYTLAGHAFVRLAHALGASWPFAANAFSALGGAVAIGLLHALSSRLLRSTGVSARGAAAVALLPAVAFAMNPVWTLETTLAEVYSWHVAWLMGVALFAHQAAERWRRPGRLRRPCGSRRSAACWRAWVRRIT